MALVNRLQATALDYRLLRLLKLLLVSSLPLSGLVLLGQLPGNRMLEGSGYWWLCRAWLGWLLVDWHLRRFSPHRRWREGAQQQQVVDLGGEGLDLSGLVHFCRRLPGNQLLQLEVNHKEMPLGSAAEGLAGLTVTHFSDLHISGQMGKQFYESLCDQVNQLSSDLVCLSGDILDDDHCREWFPETLGRLQARLGVYYVLGNHDARHADPDLLRQELAGCGLTDLAGRQHLLSHQEGQLLLAGTEVPWLGTLQALEDFPGKNPLSLLLSHSPDTIRWARRRGISLVLAGHLHGGQIRLPVIGPVVSPSFHGVRFSGGRFRCGNTLLHVSRGVGGMQPLRWNCRPELTQLKLTDDPLP
ncbi:MAG: metallophosphoesterase [Planctomycetota bacterium]|nr:metallophosphoesterase [Planctomycetota bacterium]